MFTKQFAIKIEANKIFGCSNNVTILLNEGCLRVFKILTSLVVNEKKATSLPAKKNDNKNKINNATISIVVAAGEGEIFNKLNTLMLNTE
jgi:hypothetical protein